MTADREVYVSPADAWGLSQEGCNADEIAAYAREPRDHPWLAVVADAWWRPIGWDA